MPRDRAELKQDDAPPALASQICKHCSDLIGRTSFRVKDKKGVHTCQVCRVELLPKYAERLPEIKAALPKA